MTIGLPVVGFLIAAALFVVAAIASEKNALWLPVILLAAAAVANAFAGVL
jgi:hypothetical protein